jgi:hypothetical protein
VVNFALLGAFFYLRALAALDEGEQVARRALWYVAIYPAAFFFSAAYSESIFLLAAAGVIWHSRKGEWWLAGIWCAVAALTRAQGALLALPLLWELARHWRQTGQVAWQGIFALALPAVAVLSFMAHLYVRVGDPLAFLHVQNNWGRSFAFPLVSVWRGLEIAAGGPGEMDYPLGLINTVAVVLFIVVTVFSLRRWPAQYSIYVITGLILALMLPAEGRPTESGARFMAVLFPVMFSLAAWSQTRPWLDRLIIAVWLPLFALLTALFVNWYWVV